MITTTTTTELLYLQCGACQLPVHGRGGYICRRDGLWCIFHCACDPDPDNPGYWVPRPVPVTAMDLLGLAAFLHRWGLLDGTDWDTFIFQVLRASGWKGRP
jgi:hypothetical protein